MGLGAPTLKIKIMLESNPLKSIILVQRLAVALRIFGIRHLRIRTATPPHPLGARGAMIAMKKSTNNNNDSNDSENINGYDINDDNDNANDDNNNLNKSVANTGVCEK